MQNIHLNGHQRKTLAALFRHPAAHNLEWHDVQELLGHIGTLEKRHNGEIGLTIGTEHATLQKPKAKDLDFEELKHLRTFLKKVGFDPEESTLSDTIKAASEPADSDYIVVIDHHEARLFEMHASQHEQPQVIVPHDSHGFLRHLEHRKEADYQGERVPEDHGYYGRIAAALKSASGIVILTRGTGKSNAGEYFIEYLEQHHPDLGHRVLAKVDVDLSHMTDGELIAVGRSHLPAMAA
jgi:hypothetical protein